MLRTAECWGGHWGAPSHSLRSFICGLISRNAAVGLRRQRSGHVCVPCLWPASAPRLLACWKWQIGAHPPTNPALPTTATTAARFIYPTHPSALDPCHTLTVCLSSVGVWARACVSSFCHRGFCLNSNSATLPSEDAEAGLSAMMSFVTPLRLSRLCLLYEHTFCVGVETAVGNPTHERSADFWESAWIDSAGHCSFPVFSLSLWINRASQAFHQLSSDLKNEREKKAPDDTVRPAPPVLKTVIQIEPVSNLAICFFWMFL